MGLPIGMQIIGDCFKENNIIRAAYAYEQSRDYERCKVAKNIEIRRSNGKAYETVIGLGSSWELATKQNFLLLFNSLVEHQIHIHALLYRYVLGPITSVQINR